MSPPKESNVLFTTGPDGERDDRELHNEILRGGDHATVLAATRKRMRERYGWSDEEIDEILEQNPEVTDADYEDDDDLGDEA